MVAPCTLKIWKKDASRDKTITIKKLLIVASGILQRSNPKPRR
jgi:hypothetical protein